MANPDTSPSHDADSFYVRFPPLPKILLICALADFRKPSSNRAFFTHLLDFLSFFMSGACFLIFHLYNILQNRLYVQLDKIMREIIRKIVRTIHCVHKQFR